MAVAVNRGNIFCGEAVTDMSLRIGDAADSPCRMRLGK
jgi:hypothetical protein